MQGPLDAWFLAFAAVLLATGFMRLAELSVSLKRLRNAGRQAVREPRLFPLMVLLHIGLVFAPLAEVVLLRRPFLPVIATPAFVLLLLATCLRVWTLRTIGNAWNVRVVLPDGDAVVTGGPYAFIRHPNYLAVILEVAALPLLHTAWVSCLTLSVLNGFVLFQRIRTEEAHLFTLPEWRRAMEGRARLLPGLF